MIPSLLALVQVAAQPAPMPEFLSGCWIFRHHDRVAEECWTAGNAGLMLGSGRAWVGERIDHWEWMRIERGSDGLLRFHASPRGAAPTAFTATRIGADEIVFENSAHDYPQRVRYWRTPAGMSAETSLKDGSKPDRYDFVRMGGPTP